MSVALLVLGGCNSPDSASEAKEPTLQERLSLIESRVKSIDKRLESLAATETPVIAADESALSANQERELSAIEDAAKSATATPVETTALDDLFSRYGKLNADLTMRQQTAAFDRLFELNGNLETASLVSRYAAIPPSGDDLARAMKIANLRQDISLLLEDAGDREPPFEAPLRKLATTVDTQLASLVKSISDVRSSRLAAAEGDALLELEADLESVAELVSLAESGTDEDLELPSFDVAFKRIDLVRATRTLRERLEVLNKSQLSDEIRAVALNDLLQQTLALTAGASLDNNAKTFERETSALAQVSRDLTTLSEADAKKMADKFAEANKAYQSWALGNVRRMRDDFLIDKADQRLNEFLAQVRDGKSSQLTDFEEFPNFRETVNGAAKTQISGKEVSVEDGKKFQNKYGGYVSDRTSDLSRIVCREAMIKYLTVIDERALDRPVAEVFNETWSQAWSSLEGTDHRLEIAKRSIAVKKKSIEDFLPKTSP